MIKMAANVVEIYYIIDELCKKSHTFASVL